MSNLPMIDVDEEWDWYLGETGYQNYALAMAPPRTTPIAWAELTKDERYAWRLVARVMTTRKREEWIVPRGKIIHLGPSDRDKDARIGYAALIAFRCPEGSVGSVLVKWPDGARTWESVERVSVLVPIAEHQAAQQRAPIELAADP